MCGKIVALLTQLERYDLMHSDLGHLLPLRDAVLVTESLRLACGWGKKTICRSSLCVDAAVATCKASGEAEASSGMTHFAGMSLNLHRL